MQKSSMRSSSVLEEIGDGKFHVLISGLESIKRISNDSEPFVNIVFNSCVTD